MEREREREKHAEDFVMSESLLTRKKICYLYITLDVSVHSPL